MIPPYTCAAGRLAEDGDKAYFVLLISPPDEREALCESVFVPVVDALAPLN